MVTRTHALLRPAAGTGSWLLIAALFVGVLGMHSLSVACVHPGGGNVAVASPTSPDAIDDSGAPAAPDHAQHASHDPGDNNGASVAAMAICLAVLLTVGSLWLALALRRFVRGWRVARARVPQTPYLPATARPRPAPSLFQLSILRC